MDNSFTQPKNNKTGHRFFTALLGILPLLSFTVVSAQEVIAGLTSNGGVDGRGTAFSIKTNGSDFSIIQGFADWGRTPNGDLYKDSDGSFYGMTSLGGTYSQGSIFKMTASGAVTILKHFNNAVDGASPHGELIKGADGNFYGLTSSGGTNTYGTIFKMTPAGVYTVLKHFSYATDGTNPRGHLVQAKDGNFYGINYGGGANGVGTIFKMTPAGVFTVLRHLTKTTDGGNSYSSLTEGKDGNLYGVTNGGGTYGNGTIFKITTAGVFTVLRHLNATSDGAYPQSDLVQAADGNFYGSCYSYGTYGNGTIFKITPAGVYSVLRHLSSAADGGYPYGNLFQNNDGFLYGMNRTGGSDGGGTAYKISTAGAFTKLHSFLVDTEGSTPNGGFIKGNDGNLYALLSSGGSIAGGTAIKMTVAGAVTTLASFNGGEKGNAPMETLTKGKDSAYYGTTSSGGVYGYGTIFKLCGGTMTVLHSFNRNVGGGIPLGSLIRAKDGNFYGMTSDGGANGYGTIFKITPGGVYSVLRHLTGIVDGSAPYGSLIQGTDGFLYGMTRNGGANAGGTIFKISVSGTFTVLRSLAYATDGNNPEGSLTQGADGDFYGMTSNNAKVFKITSTGTFTILRSLVSGTDGSYPFGSLVQAADGKLYGTTSSGGNYSGGTIFNITTTGTFKTMKHLNPTPDGKTPKGSLLIGSDGNFYGMTSSGGSGNAGTLFKITASGNYSVLHHFTMASDGGNPFGSLIPAPVNDLIANPQSVTTNENTQKVITLSGSGSGAFTYVISNPPKNGVLTGTGASLTYTPNTNYAGKDSFFFRVKLGCMNSTQAKVRITVVDVNSAPVLAPISKKTVKVNKLLTFTATATDADAGQTLKYSLNGAPAGAAIDPATGVFTWTPQATGQYKLTVRVADNGNPVMKDEEEITIDVKAAALTTSQEEAEVATITKMPEQRISATMYPNPVVNKFTVTLASPADGVTVQIVDINGKIISTGTYHTSGKKRIELNAAQLSPGLYFAQVRTREGTVSLRFVKQ